MDLKDLPPEQPTETGPGPSGRAIARLKLVVWLALLLPLAAFIAVAAWLWSEQFREARLRLDGDARIAQEHALKLFETNQMLLDRMRDLLGDAGDEALLARSGELHQRLKDMAADLPQVQGLFVHGADSRPIANSRVHPPPRQIDFSDREWYREQKAAEGHAVYFTDQIVSRATGEPAFDMSLRRVLPDGRYGGTVHASLRPQYLTDFYQDMAKVSPGLRMAIVRRDGAFIARWPGPVQPGRRLPADSEMMRRFASNASVGAVDGPSLLDETERLRAFRRLGDYPLFVVAAVDRDVVVAAWQRQCLLLALFLFPTALGFAWMANLALARTREELAAVERLQVETARRQRIEVALLQSQKLEAMGRLTGGVAHDFNNLLMVINSSLFLLRRLKPELAESAQVGAIERAVASGSKLTRQLLAFARKQALLPERIRLQERLPALQDLLKPLLGTQVVLDCEVAPDTAAVEVDAAELELALINLAVNARDAMQGKGSLVISARNARPGEGALRDKNLAGDYVLLEACDSGPGVDPAISARVFEPFFTTKPLGQGTGLGLAQVQALAHSAGGTATIDTAPGRGARVRLYLRGAGAAEPAPEPAPPLPQDLQGRVLLVEDNDAVADAMRLLLESMGCTVKRAAGGREAERIADADPSAIDLVLSDIEMPGGLDGIALASLLLERHPELPVILMTGYAVRLEQAVRNRLEVLPKPCSPAVLAEAVGKALARRRSQRAVSAGG